MNETIKRIIEEANQRAKEVSSLEDAEDMRVKMLGKKGALTEIMKSMKDLAPEDRKAKRSPRADRRTHQRKNHIL